MKKTIKLIGIIALVAVIGLGLTACVDDLEDAGDNVTFSVTANGSASQTSSQLTLTFNKAVAGLTAADIGLSHSVSGQTVNKGTVSGAGTAYTLPISGFTAGGTLTVTVTKTGFAFTSNPQTVTIFYVAGSTADLGNQTVAITAPVTGALPQTAVTEGLGFTGAIAWFNGAAAHTGSFAPSTVYRAQVTLTSTTGYQWPAAAPTITVTGQTVTGTAVSGTGAGNTLTFSVTFPATAANVANEFQGKTLHIEYGREIRFAAVGTAFEIYREDWDSDDYPRPVICVGAGSYSFNAADKTITISVERAARVELIFGIGGDRLELLSKTQAEGAISGIIDEYLQLGFREFLLMMGNYEDEDEVDDDIAYFEEEYGITDVESYCIVLVSMEFAPVSTIAEVKTALINYIFPVKTYDYQFAGDGAILVQERLPANIGTNELSGKTFVLSMDDPDYKFTFTASDYTYTVNNVIRHSGVYAYDSAAKRVYIRPEQVSSLGSLMGILEYYNWATGPGAANEDFRVFSGSYNPSDNTVFFGIATEGGNENEESPPEDYP